MISGMYQPKVWFPVCVCELAYLYRMVTEHELHIPKL